MFDTIGERSAWRGYRLLRCGGILVSFGVTSSVQNRRSNHIASPAGVLVLVVLMNALPDGKRATFYGITRLYRKDPKPFHEYLPERANLTECTEFDMAVHYSTLALTSQAVLAHRDLMRDITHIPIAVAAISAGVDFFISEDKDFTARDQTTAKLHQRLRVMLPGTFLRQVMGWTGEELEAIRHRTWSDLEDD